MNNQETSEASRPDFFHGATFGIGSYGTLVFSLLGRFMGGRR